MTKGIDISYCQQNIDFNKLDVDFAIIRAGYGKVSTQKDNTFERNYAELKKRGIPVGAYWYSYAKTVAEARQEAQVCIQILKGKQFEYPIYYDIEEQSQYNLGKEALSAIILAFCTELENAGFFVGLYSNPNFLDNVISETVKKRFALWVAHWNVSQPKYNGGLWQYKVGTCTGVVGDCDLDYGYVDYPQIIKQKGLNGFTADSSTQEELFNNIGNNSITVSISIAGETYSGKLQKK